MSGTIVWLVEYVECGHQVEQATDKILERKTGCPVCPRPFRLRPRRNQDRDAAIVRYMVDHSHTDTATTFGVNRSLVLLVLKRTVLADPLRVEVGRRDKKGKPPTTLVLLIRRAAALGIDLTPFLAAPPRVDGHSTAEPNTSSHTSSPL